MPELRLISGGMDDPHIGAVRVTVVAPPGPAEPVAAVVVEEDTWQVLSAAPEVVTPDEHPVRLLTGLLAAEALPPGSVLIRDEVPLLLRAAVYDVGAEPCCHPEWVAAALAAIIGIAKRRALPGIALPLLGVRHGRLPVAVVLELLVAALRNEAPGKLRRLWLIAQEGTVGEVRDLLMKIALVDARPGNS